MRIPPSMMLQPWMGSDFTNDDLARESSLAEGLRAHARSASSDRRRAGARRSSCARSPRRRSSGRASSCGSRRSAYAPLLFVYYDEPEPGRFEALRELRFSDVRMVAGPAAPARLGDDAARQGQAGSLDAASCSRRSSSTRSLDDGALHAEEPAPVRGGALMMLLRLAWRNLGRNKRRTALTAGAAVFATVLSHAEPRGLRGQPEALDRARGRALPGSLRDEPAPATATTARSTTRSRSTAEQRAALDALAPDAGWAPRLEASGLISRRHRARDRPRRAAARDRRRARAPRSRGCVGALDAGRMAAPRPARARSRSATLLAREPRRGDRRLGDRALGRRVRLAVRRPLPRGRHVPRRRRRARRLRRARRPGRAAGVPRRGRWRSRTWPCSRPRAAPLPELDRRAARGVSRRPLRGAGLAGARARPGRVHEARRRRRLDAERAAPDRGRASGC